MLHTVQKECRHGEQGFYLQDKNTAATKRMNLRNMGKNLKQKVIATSTNWIPAASLSNISDENTRINALALSTRRTRGIAEEIKKEPNETR